jgi:hypothetical protein
MVPIRVPLLTILVDDVAHVWWYDNQGAIQSHGINFVKDLPHFLVLLLCFDRFTLEDWGIIPSFIPEGGGTNGCSLSFLPPPSSSSSPVEVKIIHTEQIHRHYGIKGRATQMFSGKSPSQDPRDADKSLNDMKLVVKVYWPEASRIGEADIIDKARKIAEQNADVNGHIPDLICSRDFGEYSTKNIRTALGIASEGHRVLRVMVFRRLYPITDLIGEKFWKAFWECFLCECTSALCCNVLTLPRC